MKIWLGVNASKSLWSSFKQVNGHSTSLNNVNIWKSFKIRSLIIANIASLTVQKILFQDPFMCVEDVGLNNFWIFWQAILLPTLQWSYLDVSISSSLTAPFKFFPQSESICDERPQWFIWSCFSSFTYHTSSPNLLDWHSTIDNLTSLPYCW